MEDAFAVTVEEVLAHFEVDLAVGLTDDQVKQSRDRHGRNELPPDEGMPFWKLVLKQFDDLLVKILIVAALVDFAIAMANGERGAGAFVEPGVIILILVANATVGVVTETNAEKAIEELKAYEADVATVLRNGRLSVIPAVDLVPGDVVEIAVGGKVPADLRVAELLSGSLRADQSILTGESDSVQKQPQPVTTSKAVYQDKTCLLFSGTVITGGRGRCIVVGTGPNTAIGKIRDAMMEQHDEMTPLKQKLDEFGTFLSKAIAVICVLVWVINIPHFGDALHGGWFQGAIYYFKIAVALAVAAIPEGLPAVVTTCLALGTRKMAQQHAIVRSLPSVETLGCTTVICSDKTGTLTTNMMSVAKVAVCHSPGRGLDEYNVSGTTYAPEGSITDAGSGKLVGHPADLPCLLQLAVCSALCNDSSLHYAPDKAGGAAAAAGDAATPGASYQRVGESTEVALRVLAEKIGLQGYDSMPAALHELLPSERATYCNDYWQQQWQRVAALEFSRDRKMMSVAATHNGHTTLFTKGAPEAVLARCSTALANGGGGSVALSEALRSAVLAQVEAWGGALSLRCLALASRSLPPTHAKVGLEDEAGLRFLGLVGMHDPPRREVGAAIQTCRAAGIRVIVVTGDNRATGEAICRQVGVLDSIGGHTGEGKALTGTSFTGVEFDELSALDQATAIQNMALFARVEPSHKTRLVELLKAQGHVVAMTGDGVNDAPALRKADIGVAMGSGTAVAKHAADMVLADDNFATIVAAVAEGRAIYANTKQFIRYMVSSNIGEVVAIFLAALLGIPEVLTPVQLLWVNLVTDGLPATALGFNPADPDIMTTRPRRTTESIVTRWLVTRYLVIGLYVGIATAASSIWWFLMFKGGPQLSFAELTSFQHCEEGKHAYSCAIFATRSSRTMAMTVLVVVEMFNALNALSENSSLLVQGPWRNPWLLAAISLSMALHAMILYVPWAASLFGVTALSWPEWRCVLWLSFPVILLDEVLKLISRRYISTAPAKKGVFGMLSSSKGGLMRGLGREAQPLLPISQSSRQE